VGCRTTWLGCVALWLCACSSPDAAQGSPRDRDAGPTAKEAGDAGGAGDAGDAGDTDAGGNAADVDGATAASGAVPNTFLALTYNVAGLPAGLSSSMPELYTPLIGPLLNRYDVVLLQESWQTPDPNPAAPTHVYHEILVAASKHPYKSVPADVPWGMDPDRPSALLGDGLNMFSEYPFDETVRVRWPSCVDSESDCLALKGFSMTTMHLAANVDVDVYDLHMEAGDTPEDDAARDQDVDTLAAFIDAHSAGHAVIVGGDFNLHTDREPAATQLARLLADAQLQDACTDQHCDRPGSIDKFLFRSSAEVTLSVDSFHFETDVFVTADGEPLSDHDPLAVRFRWASTASSAASSR